MIEIRIISDCIYSETCRFQHSHLHVDMLYESSFNHITNTPPITIRGSMLPISDLMETGMKNLGSSGLSLITGTFNSLLHDHLFSSRWQCCCRWTYSWRYLCAVCVCMVILIVIDLRIVSPRKEFTFYDIFPFFIMTSEAMICQK